MNGGSQFDDTQTSAVPQETESIRLIKFYWQPCWWILLCWQYISNTPCITFRFWVGGTSTRETDEQANEPQRIIEPLMTGRRYRNDLSRLRTDHFVTGVTYLRFTIQVCFSVTLPGFCFCFSPVLLFHFQHFPVVAATFDLW